MRQIGAFLFSVFLCLSSFAEEQIFFSFIDSNISPSTLKLEGYLHEPKEFNGKIILMLHGSTGGKKEFIKPSIKFLRIGAAANVAGFRVLTFMRKGRGASEGDFTEETPYTQSPCMRSSIEREISEAYSQLDQVVNSIREKYSTDKIILMGHSRGGFLSTYYALKNPNKVLGAVNISGVWSAWCEAKNNGFNHEAFEKSAIGYKNQYWVYFQNDSYFGEKTFNDPTYEWFASTARKHSINFKAYPSGDMKDGHDVGTWKPEVWTGDVLPWIMSLK